VYPSKVTIIYDEMGKFTIYVDEPYPDAHHADDLDDLIVTLREIYGEPGEVQDSED